MRSYLGHASCLLNLRGQAGKALFMTKDTHPSGAPWRNFYGRFKGKTLRPAQEIYLREDLQALSPGPVSWEDNPTRKTSGSQEDVRWAGRVARNRLWRR